MKKPDKRMNKVLKKRFTQRREGAKERSQSGNYALPANRRFDAPLRSRIVDTMREILFAVYEKARNRGAGKTQRLPEAFGTGFRAPRAGLNLFEACLYPFETRLNRFETRLKPFKTCLKSFETCLYTFETRLNRFETRIKPFETRLNCFETRLKPFRLCLKGKFSKQERTKQ
jgi:hypothetical protein